MLPAEINGGGFLLVTYGFLLKRPTWLTYQRKGGGQEELNFLKGAEATGLPKVFLNILCSSRETRSLWGFRKASSGHLSLAKDRPSLLHKTLLKFFSLAVEYIKKQITRSKTH